MTLKELSQLYHLTREIEMDRRRLEELEAKAEPGAQRLTGMPHSPSPSNKLEDCAIEIAALRGIIQAKLQQCVHERIRLECYISGIEDSLIRQILTYRFIDGLPWAQVAANIGTGYTAASVRQIARRFIRKN